MAISNDFFIDYQNKLIVHATQAIAYDGELNTFLAGQTIGNLSSNPTKTAVIVKVDDQGATGTLDVVYVVGSWANNDELYVGATKYGDVNGTPTSKTTVYTTRALYSFVQDTFDELVQMDDTIPMSAQTPTEFTMINSWFIDDESTKYLSGGALSTSGYQDEIQVLSLDGSYTGPINSDIGKTVRSNQGGGTNIGALLAFNNTTQKWWVRSATTITNNSAMTIPTGSAAGGDANGNSDSGEDLYANIYTLGTITTDPKPKTYVFQNGSALAEWWGRGDGSAHIDVLIKVKELDALIDSGNITVFTRHFGDLYDHFPITLSSGGRNAVPLATATDINNNTNGELVLSVTDATDFTAGNFVRGLTSGAYGEILSASTLTTPDTIIVGNVVGAATFTDGETINETTDGLVSGDTATSTTLTAPHKTNVVIGYNDIKIRFVNLSVTFTSGGPTAPTVGSVITCSGSGASATLLAISLTSGTWAGNDAAGTLTLANWNSIAYSGTLDQTSPPLTDFASFASELVVDEMNKAFEQGTLYPYNVIVDCAGRTMAQVYEWFKYVTREDANSTQTNYVTMFRVSGGSTIVQEDGEEYIAALSTYSPVKASPFGTLAGGKLFAARGVWVENMATVDRQNFQLIDADGNNRTPPNFITITVTSVVSSDKVTVFRTSSGTTINKTQFASGHSNDSGDAQFFVTGTIPSDTPNTGYIRVVDSSDTSINRESRYAYVSWSNSTSSFTLSSGYTLDRTYSAGEDTAYVPYYDEIAGNTSVYVTVIYSVDQSVLTRVRRYNGANDSILPFQIAGSVTNAGYTVAAIRTPDTIVT